MFPPAVPVLLCTLVRRPASLIKSQWSLLLRRYYLSFIISLSSVFVYHYYYYLSPVTSIIIIITAYDSATTCEPPSTQRSFESHCLVRASTSGGKDSLFDTNNSRIWHATTALSDFIYTATLDDRLQIIISSAILIVVLDHLILAFSVFLALNSDSILELVCRIVTDVLGNRGLHTDKVVFRHW